MNENTKDAKLIILDRDGVINQDSDDYIKSVEEWIPIPGSLEAIARLNHAGYRVIVATNQSGLGRGYFDIDTLNAIHNRMQQKLAALGAQIEAIFLCPHTPDTHCRCRKPLPGLLEDIAERLRTDLTGIPMIGDSLKDIQVANAVGASPSLVLTGKGQSAAEKHRDDLTGIPIYQDLSTAVDALLAG